MNRVLIAALLAVAILTPAYAATPKTPQAEIIYRASLGRADDVKLLLDKGVFPDTVNEDGVPLIALAASRTDEEGINVVKTLLEKNANINAKDSKGATALFYAARLGNKDIVQYLLEQGADYYLVDNNGDIARNFAHRERHPEIVKLMDDFVKAQTEKIHKQYLEVNEQLKAQYEEQEKQQGRSPSSETGAKEKAKADDELAKALQRQEDMRKELDAKRQSPEFWKTLHDLSFQSCAYQYWFFVRGSGQSIKLSPTEIDISIDSHKEQIRRLSDELAHNYKLEMKWVNTFSKDSKLRVFHQLKTMPSNTYRFEHGVGKAEDVQTRCEAVATAWRDTYQDKNKDKDESYESDDDNVSEEIEEDEPAQ